MYATAAPRQWCGGCSLSSPVFPFSRISPLFFYFRRGCFDSPAVFIVCCCCCFFFIPLAPSLCSDIYTEIVSQCSFCFKCPLIYWVLLYRGLLTIFPAAANLFITKHTYAHAEIPPDLLTEDLSSSLRLVQIIIIITTISLIKNSRVI